VIYYIIKAIHITLDKYVIPSLNIEYLPETWIGIGTVPFRGPQGGSLIFVGMEYLKA
jgi:hypothetical protein